MTMKRLHHEKMFATLSAFVAAFVLDLTLARTAVGDDTLDLVAGMPRLERLDLSGTQVTNTGIAALRAHPLTGAGPETLFSSS